MKDNPYIPPEVNARWEAMMAEAEALLPIYIAARERCRADYEAVTEQAERLIAAGKIAAKVRASEAEEPKP